jgi:hypothetical protein
MGARESSAAGVVAPALAAFDQTVAIQHGVDGAGGRRLDHREGSDDFVPDLGSTPSGMFLLEPDDRAFDLIRQRIRVSVGPSRSILEGVEAALCKLSLAKHIHSNGMDSYLPLNGLAMCQAGDAHSQLHVEKESGMEITRVEMDLAKNVFQVHGVDRSGRTAWCRHQWA